MAIRGQQQEQAQAEVSVQNSPATPFINGGAGLGANTNAVSANHAFVKMMLDKVAGSQLVQIVAVTNSGGVEPVGQVDVTILTNQTDGDGNGTPHGTIHSLPYARAQGGSNGIIIDPEVGDIGVAVFCDRDISTVKKTGARANPGSRRRNSHSDGVYLHSCIAKAPSQFIRFHADGIEVLSPKRITFTAPEIELNASTGVTINSPLVTVSGDLTAEGTSVHTHRHGGTMPGGGTTGVPE